MKWIGLEQKQHIAPDQSFNLIECKVKATGSFRITDEILKASSDAGVKIVTNLMISIIKEGTVLDDWRKYVTDYLQ